jgi:predicted transcriptional regulator
VKETLSQHKTTRARPKTLHQIQIAELDDRHARASDELLAILRELITSNDPQYPGIDLWFAKKVIPGLLSGERKAYLAFAGEIAVGAAILKRGRFAKFCHLRITDEYQGVDLGQVFFIQMVMDVLSQSDRIHFTLPESLWAEKREFFKSFGFSKVTAASRFYRTGDPELLCSAAISTVVSAAARKLPGILRRFLLSSHSASSELLMSVKPIFAERMVAGSKSIEIRKHFSEKWVGHDAVIYATKPSGGIVGRTMIRSVTKGHPDALWASFGSQIGCSRSQYDSYVGNAPEVIAVGFDKVAPYETPVPIDQLERLLCLKLYAPQSFAEVSASKNQNWKRALYLANLLRHRGAYPSSLKT